VIAPVPIPTAPAINPGVDTGVPGTGISDTGLGSGVDSGLSTGIDTGVSSGGGDGGGD
jgi:hypothetical protein